MFGGVNAIKKIDENIYEVYDKSFFFQYNANSNFQALPHRHNTSEIIIVEKGQSTIIISDKIINIRAPFIAYYPPYEIHEQINNKSLPYSRYLFRFNKSILGDEPQTINNFFAIEITPDELKRLRHIASFMMKYCSEQPESECDNQRLKYVLLLLLNELSPIVNKHMPELTASAKCSYIRDVCKFINEHYSEHLSLEIISDRFFISRAKLTHDFKKTLSMTVNEYIAAVRIGHSKILLHDKLALDEIAERCGFSSSSYYIAIFKSITGMTPSQYRMIM